ncbi:pyrophosphatase PpaX [Saccharibacillus sp. CPCC 101409]|uniref:pyrophosphatase PpaX n=1 Tax=Saccharibacillus sp. CPCC 101409 TaxID=3058041 RepID=UPI002671A6A8|nr:pyrophosphatase PpaX [Saccharibacillus sp. CPCC 101409]MDO3413128.1 pyrophosphatase PpaX [Saccharibacillus sp. CPCC 101409]
MSGTIKTVLFDLDGTIIDTNQLIIDSFMHTMSDIPLTRETIIPHMGTTLQNQLRVFSGLQDVAELEKAYRTYNLAHHDAMVKPFPHVQEVVQNLHAAGIRLGVVTTKIRPTSMKVLEMFDLYRYMDAVVTVTDVTHPKPHAEPVLKALEQLGASKETALMVGDSPADIKSAQNAGVRAAAVAWSLKGEQTLSGYNPDYMLRDMRDLYALTGTERVQS